MFCHLVNYDWKKCNNKIKKQTRKRIKEKCQRLQNIKVDHKCTVTSMHSFKLLANSEFKRENFSKSDNFFSFFLSHSLSLFWNENNAQMLWVYIFVWVVEAISTNHLWGCVQCRDMSTKEIKFKNIVKLYDCFHLKNGIRATKGRQIA